MPLQRAVARSGVPGDCPDTVLPRAHSVLAAVGRPGEEAYYLGAILDAFRSGGTKVSALVLTRGDADPPPGGGAKPASSPQAFEFEMASFVLRVTHRLMIDTPDGGLGEAPADARVRAVLDMIGQCSADLLLTADVGAVDSPVVDAVCAAGRTAGVPVLAWTLPADMAEKVLAAGGRGVPDRPVDEADFAIRVARKVQRRAMRAHRSQMEMEHAQIARLDVQGDREWLHWLVLPDRRAHTQGR
ncbi:MAG TPA: hypothetical protein VFU43_15555 [Streptosporangiaceae bacterium]|nr:hypothetical protein [Streptosporangiaceae bacterium]